MASTSSDSTKTTTTPTTTADPDRRATTSSIDKVVGNASQDLIPMSNSSMTNSPTSSSNSNTTSSSDLTKLTKIVHESTDPPPPPTDEDGEPGVVEKSGGSVDESSDVDMSNLKSNKSHKGDGDEGFSSSLSVSTLSTASSSGGDVFPKKAISVREGGPTSTSNTNNPMSTSMKANSPNDNPTSTSSSRKREHNRRKSSDPVSVKKLPRLVESDDDLRDNIDLDDEEEELIDDYDLLDEQDEEDDDPLDFTFDLRRNNANRKPSRNQSNNRKSNPTLSSTTLKQTRSTRYNHSSSNAEEKVINSSNEEYETSITQSESDDSTYNIRWKNHQTHILLAFESLLQNETFCDVTLICDDEELTPESDNDCREDQRTLKGTGILKLRAHKIVLSACSEYFQRIFAENPCKHPVIVLKDYESWEIQALLDFMYRGEVDVSLERLASLVKTAESLQIRGLTDSLGKLGPDLFKQNPPFLPKSNNNNNNNKTKTHKSYADNSSSRNRKSQDGFLSLSRVEPGALNLSMDLNPKNNKRSSSQSDMEGPMMRNNNNNNNNNISTNAMSLVKTTKSRSSGGGGNTFKSKPQNLSIVETTSMHKDKDSYPSTTRGNPIIKAGLTNHHNNIPHQYHHHLNHLNHHHHHLLPEDQGQNSGNDEDGEINQNHSEDFHNPAGTRQNLLPRRKQARPRRRSGDYMAQDLRKIMSSLTHQGNLNQETFDLINLTNLRNLRSLGDEDEDEPPGKLEIRLSRDEDHPDSQQQYQQQLQAAQLLQEQSPHPDNPLLNLHHRHHQHSHHHHHNHHHQADTDDLREEGSPTGRGPVVMTRLAQRRRSSRRHNHQGDRDLSNNPNSPINLRNPSKQPRSNGNNNGSSNSMEDDSNGMMESRGEGIIEEDEVHQGSNRVLDYRTRDPSPGNKKLKSRGISAGLQFPGQGHLPFLRNWSPTLGNNNPTPPPLGHQRSSPMKQEGDSDDGISSTADQCPSSPLLSPTMDPKQFLSRHMNNHNSPHDFSLFGLHPDHPHNLQRSSLVGALQFNKQSPPSPSNFFLGPLGSMSITPIAGNGGDRDRDDSRAGTPSTPPNVFSPAGFPMQLPMGIGSGNSLGSHHLNSLNNHHLHGGKEDRDGERGGRGGGKDGTRGSPVGWPGLPLGPPPIFGRHRAQHSAPRGGPPRAWSNADLTEALHNVWNKKMTTSQASRIFGIPYNSLLMYVRGKYGKSLKLDLLKKGLDQAMENSQNSAANNNSNNTSSNTTNATSTSPPVVNSPSSTNSMINNANPNNNNSSTNTNATTSPPTQGLGLSITASNNSSSNNSKSNNNNNNTSNSSVKGHSNSNSSQFLSSLSSEHNNNNTGMGHLHQHLQNLHNHHQQQQQQHHHNNKSNKSVVDRVVGLELPHDLPPGFNPFTAASIFGEYPSPFPFASALSHILPQSSLVNQHGGLSHPGLGRNDKVSVGDDEK